MSETHAKPVLAPMDEHNTKLIANVHPHDWVNPRAQDRYHLVVIGAGTAGLISAIMAAGAGARVALIERHFMGGDCLNVGCVPSKGVISAARAWHTVNHAHHEFGAPQPGTTPGDFAAAMARMRRLRAGISPHDSVARYRDMGVDVFLGEGRFIASDAVEVAGQRLEFRRAVIATGARATGLPIPGLSDAGFLTNETIFSLTALPQSLGVIGGGPIGCELAQSFARFGAKVSIFDIAPHLLPREDADAAAIVQAALVRDGIDLYLGVQLQGVQKQGDGLTIVVEKNGQATRVTVEKLLLAVGRAPNVEGLGLEAAGVAYDRTGVKVDDLLRTSNPRIFAAGDIASPYKFTHAADALARIAVQNALFVPRLKASSLVVPWCTYTSPEVAHVGMYEGEAKAKGLAVETLTVPLAGNDRAILEGETEGFLRVHLKQGTDQILGGTLVAAHAGELIGSLCLAIAHQIGLSKFASTILPYPTQGEIFRRVAGEYQKTKLTPRVKQLLGLWLKIFS